MFELQSKKGKQSLKTKDRYPGAIRFPALGLALHPSLPLSHSLHPLVARSERESAQHRYARVRTERQGMRGRGGGVRSTFRLWRLVRVVQASGIGVERMFGASRSRRCHRGDLMLPNLSKKREDDVLSSYHIKNPLNGTRGGFCSTSNLFLKNKIKLR